MTDHRIWKAVRFVIPTELEDEGFREVGGKRRTRTVAFQCECGDGFDDVEEAKQHIQNHD